MTSRLPTLPRIDVLQLAQVTAVPGYHPEHDTFRPFPVHAFVVHHPDGPIIVDTGIGFGNDLIDAQCVINSHLHFDHFGQNHVLSCPVVVQRAEIDAARHPTTPCLSRPIRHRRDPGCSMATPRSSPGSRQC